jgi:hypothetical protein
MLMMTQAAPYKLLGFSCYLAFARFGFNNVDIKWHWIATL